MKTRYLFFGIFLIVGFWSAIMLSGYSIILGQKLSTPTANKIDLEKIDFSKFQLTLENVYAEIMANEIKFSEIVLRQVIIETGWLTSYNCLERHNLFGMKGGVTSSINENGYACYKNWMQSIEAYSSWQERNYGDSDLEYYSFLESIGYAESTEYISKLKSIKLIIVKSE